MMSQGPMAGTAGDGSDAGGVKSDTNPSKRNRYPQRGLGHHTTRASRNSVMKAIDTSARKRRLEGKQKIGSKKSRKIKSECTEEIGTLRSENEKLEADNRKLRSENEKLEADNRKLREKLNSFTERMGKAVDIQIGSSGLLSEDLKNPCRESELKIRYNKLRQNDWAEFLGKLKKSKSHSEQQQKESGSCDFKKDAQDAIKKTLKKAESDMQGLIKKLKELLHLNIEDSSNTKTLQHFDLAIQQIQMAILYKEQIPEDLTYQKHSDLKPMVVEAYKMGCLMALHNPPISLDWKNEKGAFPDFLHDLKANQNMTTPTAMDSKDAGQDGKARDVVNSKDAGKDGNTPSASSKDMQSGQLDMLGVSMIVCLSALRWTGDLSSVYPAFRPMTAGIGASTPVTLKEKRLRK